MGEEAALLRAICAVPADDTPRLVYADWLDENGQGDRAEFIRASVRRSTMTVSYNAATGPWPGGDKATICDLLRRRGHEWLGPYYEAANGRAWAWRRGFVEAATCSAADWITHADAVRAAHPIERVTLATVPEVDLRDVTPTRKAAARLRGRSVWVEFAGARLPDFLHDLLAAEWPGITFDLQLYPTVNTATGEPGPDVPYAPLAVEPPPPAVPTEGWRIEVERDAFHTESSPGSLYHFAQRRGRLSWRGERTGRFVDMRGVRFGPVVATDRGGRPWRCEGIVHSTEVVMDNRGGVREMRIEAECVGPVSAVLTSQPG